MLNNPKNYLNYQNCSKKLILPRLGFSDLEPFLRPMALLNNPANASVLLPSALLLHRMLSLLRFLLLEQVGLLRDHRSCDFRYVLFVAAGWCTTFYSFRPVYYPLGVTIHAFLWWIYRTFLRIICRWPIFCLGSIQSFLILPLDLWILSFSRQVTEILALLH